MNHSLRQAALLIAAGAVFAATYHLETRVVEPRRLRMQGYRAALPHALLHAASYDAARAGGQSPRFLPGEQRLERHASVADDFGVGALLRYLFRSRPSGYERVEAADGAAGYGYEEYRPDVSQVNVTAGNIRQRCVYRRAAGPEHQGTP